MKKTIVLILISILLLVLDNSFVPFMAIKEIYPSFIYVFAICFSIKNGRWDAIQIGIISGVLQDVFFINTFGINCLVNMLLCLIAAIIGEMFYKDNFIVPAVVNFILAFMKVCFVTLILTVLGKYSFSINSNIVLFSLYNMLISIVIYVFVYNLSEKDYMKENWEFKNRG
ncbi:rod shape-determining protein MreD [Clostridium sp. DL1XJH146]